MTSALSRRQRRVAYAFGEALFCSPDGPPPPARLEWLCDQLDAYLVHSGSGIRRAFRWLLTAVSLLAPLFVWRLPGLARLPVERRIVALDRMEHGLLAGMVVGVKAILCVAWYEHPEVASEVGYCGRCLTEAGVEAGAAEASP